MVHERNSEDERLGSLLESFRPRLQRMVRLRIDPRLRSRVDPSDVLQETYIEVSRRLDEYRRAPGVPFFIWVRFIAGQKLVELHRRHLGAEKRDVRREARRAQGDVPSPDSSSLADLILDDGTSPSGAAIRAEERQRLHALLEGMKSIDREVLVMRHFEHLTNNETADALGLSKAGASLRYTRAAKRLSELLEQFDPDRGEA